MCLRGITRLLLNAQYVIAVGLLGREPPACSRPATACPLLLAGRA